jgi:hypothetical protein
MSGLASPVRGLLTYGRCRNRSCTCARAKPTKSLHLERVGYLTDTSQERQRSFRTGLSLQSIRPMSGLPSSYTLKGGWKPRRIGIMYMSTEFKFDPPDPDKGINTPPPPYPHSWGHAPWPSCCSDVTTILPYYPAIPSSL